MLGDVGINPINPIPKSPVTCIWSSVQGNQVGEHLRTVAAQGTNGGARNSLRRYDEFWGFWGGCETQVARLLVATPRRPSVAAICCWISWKRCRIVKGYGCNMLSLNKSTIQALQPYKPVARGCGKSNLEPWLYGFGMFWIGHKQKSWVWLSVGFTNPLAINLQISRLKVSKNVYKIQAEESSSFQQRRWWRGRSRHRKHDAARRTWRQSQRTTDIPPGRPAGCWL